MKISPLPPLNSLIVFESAARNLSFTKASTELNVTQGAVSRQIRHLESYLGKELFIRANRNLVLTPVGQQYYQAIYNSLTEVANATANIKKWQGDNQVTVVTTNALAALWLLPKVRGFEKSEEFDLRILATDNIADLNKIDYDIALFYCHTPPANTKSTFLFSEEVFPVCSSSYFDNHALKDKEKYDIFSTLLVLDEPQKDWVTWDMWFKLLNYPAIKPKNKININNYPMLLQAAIQGHGIALGWKILVDEYLQNGSLIRPSTDSLITKAQFRMLEPDNRNFTQPSVKYFRQWILSQLDIQEG